MFKMPTGVAALVVAGLECLACTDGSRLKPGGGSGNGGQAGSSPSSIGGQTAHGSGGSGTGGQSDCICDAIGPGGTTVTGGTINVGAATVTASTWVNGSTGTGGAGVGGTIGTGPGGLGTSATAGAAGSAGTCSSDQDCPSSQVCGYEADITCSNLAHCIPSEFCNDVTVGCGCDGSVVSVGCGVASRPFKGTGACAGGTGGAPNGTPVPVAQLTGKEVLPCADGYAHPNICCRGAPYLATTCTEDLTRPFDDCQAEQLAYPNPNVCCSLDNKTTCLQPSGANATADAGQASNCRNPCSPGAYPPPPFLDGHLCAFGTGIMSADAVEQDPPAATPCSLCTGPVQWCSNPCPAGWSAPAGSQVDLCCQTDSSGRRFCFSQAGYIGGADGGGVGYSDAASGCRDEQFIGDGNSYVATCDFTGSGTCNCLFNGVVERTFPSPQIDTIPAWVDPCGISISQCGFPPL